MIERVQRDALAVGVGGPAPGVGLEVGVGHHARGASVALAGFEVVGVSFDQKKNAWVNAVQQMGMRWPQMSDLQVWQCSASDIYGVRSIPASVLLDPQGKIIAIDLRGKALGEKLKEIYGE